jgi:hypothetical protein
VAMLAYITAEEAAHRLVLMLEVNAAIRTA